jgi:phospholipase C
VRVRNKDQDDQTFTIVVDHPETVQILAETRIPFQLINRVFAQALLALGLRIRIDSGQARIEFDRTFHELTGVEDRILSVPGAIDDVNLEEFTVEIGNESNTPTIKIGLDLEDRGEEIGLPGPDVDLENLAIQVRIHITFAYAQHDFFVSAPCRENGQFVRQPLGMTTYLDMNPDIDGLWADFADWILRIKGSSLSEEVQKAIDAAEIALNGAVQKAATYVQDVIMHLVDRRRVLFRITADDDAMIVVHHRRPTARDFFDDDIVVTPDDIDVIATGVRTPPTTGGGDDSAAPGQLLAIDAGSAPPEVAAVTGGAPTPRMREGDIDHIVVLMMENRSFDHMLGFRRFAHPDVNGLTGHETNPFSNSPPYRVHHLTQTAGIRSPQHGHGDTLRQIADGAMSGFVQDYSTRSNNPQLVMGYYDQRELPMYEFLANNYAICDRWHSAHPGATQCNRFATLTGSTPELENLELDDNRLGYFNGFSVLDYLSDIDVDWVYAEGNVGFLRMFDRYRIDIDHVIPYRDDHDQAIEDTFVNRVLSGNLPSVSFVDPRYIDIPPDWDSNDDLPPSDVCRGQELVAHLYALLTSRPSWATTMLIVTYDEHGGFYDHEPPAGMPVADNPAPFPPIHPDGPTHLGVRVPAFVVSPWVDGGTVFHTTYDHTSILKTILQRFAPADLAVTDMFGPRTAAANGLLTEQLRTTPRRQPPPPPPEFECEVQPGPQGPSAGIDADEFQLSMRLLGVPAKYRRGVQL